MMLLMKRIVTALLFLVSFSAFGQVAVLEMKPGWNLLGNSFGLTIGVSETFGYVGQGATSATGVTSKVTSVWKWDAYNQQWQFYSPLIDPAYLAEYAKYRGLGVLENIQPGEGFWVFAKAPAALLLAAYPAEGVLDSWDIGGLVAGWSLIASPVSVTPSGVSAMLTNAPPSVSDAGSNSSVISLWAWDTDQGKWYFYSPGLEQSCGPSCVQNYTAQRGFLDFLSTGKRLEPGAGFWINYGYSPLYYGGEKG